MALTFADTYNMIAYLTKLDASEGFEQIIDFLNASSVKYALVVNPNIYVSCIKQFWSSVSVKKVNDVMRLQALVDKKKLIITEATIRKALRLDDAESIDCYPMSRSFLSYQGWRTSWNEFGSSMASAVICLSTDRNFNFSKVRKGFSRVETPLFEGMIVAQQADEAADEGAAGVNVDAVHATDEPSIPSPTPTIQPQPPSQELPSTSQALPTPPPSLISQPPSPQQQPQPSPDAKISMDLLHTLLETCTTLTRRVKHLEQDKISQTLKITKLKQRVKKLERRNKLKASKLRRLKRVGTAQRFDTSEDTVMDDVSKHGEIIANMDADEDVTLMDVAVVTKEVAVEKTAEIKENADV
nr:hypothetical protein [Tanacetum cinerariifolium]